VLTVSTFCEQLDDDGSDLPLHSDGSPLSMLFVPEPDFARLQQSKAYTQHEVQIKLDKWSALRRWWLWPLSKHANTVALQNRGEFRVLFAALTEARRVEYEENVPCPATRNFYADRVDPSNMWMVRFRPPDGFPEVNNELTRKAPDPDHVRACVKCMGSGEVACKMCDEKHTVLCWNCKGSGKVPSSTEDTCPTCLGLPTFIRGCKTCRGTGLTTKLVKVECSVCKGRGRTACPVCKGRGTVKCHTCDGLGGLARFPSVKATYHVRSNVLRLGHTEDIPKHRGVLDREILPHECFGGKLPSSFKLLCSASTDGVPDFIDFPKLLGPANDLLIRGKLASFMASVKGRILRVGIAVVWRPYTICRVESSSGPCNLVLYQDGKIQRLGRLPLNPWFYAGAAGAAFSAAWAVALLGSRSESTQLASVFPTALGIISAITGWMVQPSDSKNIAASKPIDQEKTKTKSVCPENTESTQAPAVQSETRENVEPPALAMSGESALPESSPVPSEQEADDARAAKSQELRAKS
jgi:hypothetical protein